MQQFLLEAADPGTGAMSMLPMMLLMIAVFYLFLIRPQKKREKETAEMRNALEVGDEIMTNGGILGRVVTVREDSLLIESGSANTKLRIAKGAIQVNMTAQEKIRERQAEAAKAKEEAKARQKEDKDRLKEEKKQDM